MSFINGAKRVKSGDGAKLAKKMSYERGFHACFAMNCCSVP